MSLDPLDEVIDKGMENYPESVKTLPSSDLTDIVADEGWSEELRSAATNELLARCEQRWWV